MRTTFEDYLSNNNCGNGIDIFSSEVAFIGVDLQNDFGNPKGSLYVKGGELLGNIAIITSEYFEDGIVFWTKDWHPINHCSFKENGGIWPVHCVQNESGSEILDIIDILPEDKIICKGTSPDVDSYSAFFDNDKKTATNLHSLLQENGIKKLFVMGIATDYCVKFTVLDALKLGYEVALYLPGCVGVASDTTEAAIKEMEECGAIIITE